MSDLPDLNTDSIGFIAYFNIVDDGNLSQSFDITEILNSGNVSTSELYDNGVEGTYNDANGTTINFRGKDDGWVITWRGRDGVDQPQQNSPPRGKWDFVRDWSDPLNNTPSISTNTLERAINDLVSQLSVSSSISYSSSKVGLYNYEFPDATTATLLEVQRYDGNNNDYDVTSGITFTPDTTLYDHWGLVGIENDGSGSNSSFGTTEAKFDGTQLAYVSVSGFNSYGEGYAARDLIAKDLGTATDGTQHPAQLKVHGDYGYAAGSLTHLVVWG